MLLEQATLRNVTRATDEINGFEWEGDFKPMARQALKGAFGEAAWKKRWPCIWGLSRYEHGSGSA